MLARNLTEGLEGQLEKFLSACGYQPGHDFHFENGLHVADPETAQSMCDAINAAGLFSFCVFDPDTGKIEFDPQADLDAGPPINTTVDPGPEPEVDPETLVMCDNCGSHVHHTDECPYSFGANPQ